MENLYNTTTVNNLTEQRGVVGRGLRWLERLFGNTGAGGAVRGREAYKAAFKRVNQELPFNWMNPIRPVPANVPIGEFIRLFPGVKSLPGDSKTIWKYLTRVSPVPNGAVKEIFKSAGLGPAIAAFGWGLFLRWAALALLLTWCRFLISVLSSLLPEQIAEWVETNLGIKEFEFTSTDTIFTNLMTNFVNSVYMPDVFFTVPGYVILPYIYAAIKWATVGSARSQEPVQYILNVHDRIESGIKSIVGMTKKIPQDLIDQFPPSQRGNIRMNDTSIYWKTPDHPIENFAESNVGKINLTSKPDDYAILIPGDGWYRIKDVDFE